MRKALLLVANRSAKIVSGKRKMKAGNGTITSIGSHTVFVATPCPPVCGSNAGYSAGLKESLTAQWDFRREG